ncbi:hypothetical protein WICMUC_001890 [Wickerhamomyces mucosus]|uniref:Uncharacterized protein n=1 Tax=Wickerhamomyces mucosus TaxID=1378264 RepID=A0A9P8TFX2_9ASCO|nr:hypothetical protein WICMUC_001890 [Wickerhamomyces mucosus]
MVLFLVTGDVDLEGVFVVGDLISVGEDFNPLGVITLFGGVFLVTGVKVVFVEVERVLDGVFKGDSFRMIFLIIGVKCVDGSDGNVDVACVIIFQLNRHPPLKLISSFSSLNKINALIDSECPQV